MSSSRRKFPVKHPVVVNSGCSCGKPKLSSFFFSSSPPLQKQRRNPNKYVSPSISNTSSSSPSNTTSSTSQVFFSSKQSRMGKESVAVEKESSDPYVDFRNSMLQMIVEKEIYNWSDLSELLHLFLSLNSPCHHKIIIQAFGEILNGVPFSPGR